MAIALCGQAVEQLQFREIPAYLGQLEYSVVGLIVEARVKISN